MSAASESDEMMNDVGSPGAIDDANSGGSVGGNNYLKKGPWTSAEDATLIEYVTKHGEGNWNAVQKHSGLARCGKSCRLRWANHLRPNLKKGVFSPEEEQHIIELHAKIGNKWARMAAELPGRTDNEIKNYWNTRIKRRQRAGLPIYPPDICSQSLNESDHTHTFSSSSGGDPHYPLLAPSNNIFEIRAIEFKNLKFTQHQFYQAEFLNFPTNYHAYPNSTLVSSTLHPPPKRLRDPEPFFSGIGKAGQYQQNSRSFMYSASAYDPNSNLSSDHAVINGNPCSSSEPAWAMKLELPSLQTEVGSWGPPPSPLPSLESVDTFIQTFLDEHTTKFPAQNSGLLDAVLCESNTMKNSKNVKTSHYAASDEVFGVKDILSRDFHETEWDEAYCHQTASPLCNSSLSVFSEGTTPISGNSFDEMDSLETIQGRNVKEPASTLVPIQYSNRVETTNEKTFTRPDLMLASDCFGPMKDLITDHSLINDAIGKLLSDDLSRDYQKPVISTTPQGHHAYDDSCAWNSV